MSVDPNALELKWREFYRDLGDMRKKMAVIESQLIGIANRNLSTLNAPTQDSGHAQNNAVHFPKTSVLVTDLNDTTLADPPADKELFTYETASENWINRTQKEAIPELEAFNGTFIEKFGAVITSAGGVITLTLTEVNAGNLTMLFSDGYTTLDVTPGATIVLTAGASDAAPQANYIYILQSGKVLAKDTSAWPATEHIKVGYFLVPTAVFVAANNVYVNQNWNDGTDATQGQGHISHITQRSRYFGARYFSGVDPAGGDDYLTLGVGTVDYKSGAGVVWQMHSHTFGAFDTSGGDLVLVKNWNGDAYHDITDLFDIVDDSAGVALANKWFTLVVWGVCNQSGELDYIMINLPSGSYTTEAKATEDASSYTDFSIPRQFSLDSSTGFLIAAIVVKQAGTWLYGSTKDLRGITSAFAVAGATGTGITDHGSLTGLAVDDHTQYSLVDGTRAFSGDIDLSDNDILDIGNIGSATDEMSGDIFLADSKKTIFGSDQDLSLQHTGASAFLINLVGSLFIQNAAAGANHIFLDSHGSVVIRDRDDGSANLFNFDTTGRTLAIFSDADPGIVTIGGDGADDASLVLPYLTGAPGTLANGAIWMENDGLHIYWNGAEKLVAGV